MSPGVARLSRGPPLRRRKAIPLWQVPLAVGFDRGVDVDDVPGPSACVEVVDRGVVEDVEALDRCGQNPANPLANRVMRQPEQAARGRRCGGDPPQAGCRGELAAKLEVQGLKEGAQPRLHTRQHVCEDGRRDRRRGEAAPTRQWESTRDRVEEPRAPQAVERERR